MLRKLSKGAMTPVNAGLDHQWSAISTYRIRYKTQDFFKALKLNIYDTFSRKLFYFMRKSAMRFCSIMEKIKY